MVQPSQLSSTMVLYSLNMVLDQITVFSSQLFKHKFWFCFMIKKIKCNRISSRAFTYLFTYLFIYSTYLTIYSPPRFHQSIPLSLHLSIHLSNHLSIHLSISLSISLSIYLSPYLFYLYNIINLYKVLETEWD